MWRNANPAITDLWWDVGDAALQAVADQNVTETHGLTFSREAGFLFIRLPNGRRLAYPRPRIEIDRFGKDGLTYEGMEQGRKTWGRVDTYGPKLVENIVQAISRDILAAAMLRLAAAGYRTVMHVHDEVIIEADTGSLDTVCEIMGQTPEWAAGLPLRADGYECEFYRKE
jgi:DNA polymerase